MTEIDITDWWKTTDDEALRLLSGSIAELGPRAGALTWENAMRAALAVPELSEEHMQALTDYFIGMGAWESAEIAAWSNQHMRAMVVQECASAAREWGLSGETPDTQWPSEECLTAEEEHRRDTRVFLPVYPVRWNPDGTPAAVIAMIGN